MTVGLDKSTVSFVYDMPLFRLLIFALHFNENFGREQAKTAAGTEKLQICFPKSKQGEFTPKPIPVPKTYS